MVHRNGVWKRMSTTRVNTTIDKNLKKIADDNNIVFSNALELGVKMMLEEKSEAYEILQSRIDYLEDKLSVLEDSLQDVIVKMRLIWWR